MVPQIQIQNSGLKLECLLGSIMLSQGNDYHRKAGNQILTGSTEALYLWANMELMSIQPRVSGVTGRGYYQISCEYMTESCGGDWWGILSDLLCQAWASFKKLE